MVKKLYFIAVRQFINVFRILYASTYFTGICHTNVEEQFPSESCYQFFFNHGTCLSGNYRKYGRYNCKKDDYLTSVAAGISEVIPQEKRGEGTGYFSLTMLVTMAVAPILAIIILNRYNFNMIAIISIILIGIGAAIFQMTSIPQIKANPANKKRKLIDWENLFEKQALLPSILCFLLTSTLCGIMSYIILFGKELEMTNIWIYFIGHVLMILMTISFVGKVFDKRGHAVIIIPGVISIFLGLIVLSYVHSVITLIIASMLYGLGYGAVHPSLHAWAVNRAPADRKGAANGIFLSFMDLSFTVGSIVLGAIAAHNSYAIMYRVSSLFMVVFLGIYGYHLIKSRGVIEREREFVEDIEN